MMRINVYCGLPLLALIAFSSYGNTPPQALVCNNCHNSAIISSTPEIPRISGQHARYLQQQLAAYQRINDGRQGRQDPVMNAMVAALSATDIAVLANYYGSLPSPTPAPANNTANTDGARLYQDGDLSREVAACSACHGHQGQGLAAAGFPMLAGQSAVYIRKQLLQFRSGVRTDQHRGMMKDNSAKLTDQDIEELAEYIQQLAQDESHR